MIDQNIKNKSISGVGGYASIGELDTRTGAVTFALNLDTGNQIIPAGTSYAAAVERLEGLINNPSTDRGTKRLLADALNSIRVQNAELLRKNQENIQPNRQAEPVIAPLQPPGIAAASPGPLDTEQSQNSSQDDSSQVPPVSTQSLARGTTQVSGELARPSGASASLPLSTGAVSAAAQADSESGNQSRTTGTVNPAAPSPTRINPLSQLSSYTYSLTLYMVTPEKMNEFIANGGKLTDIKGKGSGVYIVTQSGGINNSVDDRLLKFRQDDRPGQTVVDGEGYDYYIDDLVLTTFLPGGENRATVSSEIKFKIYEPYSFNFMTDLSRASIELNKTSELARSSTVDLNGFQQHYILGIKFYGYDVDGNPITSGDPRFGRYDNGDVGDQNAIIQRFFAMTFTNIKFKLDGKTTVYQCEAVIVSEQQAYNQSNGSMKEPANLTGGTVGEVLLGNTNGSRGLIQTINTMNGLLAETGQVEIPNRFAIKFLDDQNRPVEPETSEIARSRLLDDGTFKASLAALSRAQSTEKVSVADSFKSVTIDVNTRLIGVNAGQPLTVVIDNIIAKSNWVSDALTKTATDDPESKTLDKPTIRNLRWYTINPVVKVLGMDNKTKTWAYDITYQIKPYEVPYVRTTIADRSKYPGPFKFYNYLLTGLNTEIVSYEQTFDNLYYTIASVSTNPSEQSPPAGHAPSKPQNTPGSSDPNGGKNNKGSTLNDQVRAQLYSPADQAQAKIRILGDPDYIMSTVGVEQTSVSSFYGNDGSISPLGGQVFIQIAFKTASDYFPNGLMDVTDRIQFYQTERPRKAGIEGMVYMVKQVDSAFSRGQFTQTLDCLMVDEDQLVTPERSQDADAAREPTPTSPTPPPQTARPTASPPAAGAPVTNGDARTTGTPTNPSPPGTGVQPNRFLPGRAKSSTASQANRAAPAVAAPSSIPNNTLGVTNTVNDDAATYYAP